MPKIDYLNELKELDVLLLKNMFSCAKSPKVRPTASPLQLKIFKYLKDHKKQQVRQADLEQALNVSRATISTTLLAMEHSGAIERTASPDDARVKYVTLTEKSLKAYQDMQRRMDELNRRLVQNISDANLATFLSVVAAMKANLQP